MSIEILIHGDKDKYSPKELLDKYDRLSYNMEILYGKPIEGNFYKSWSGDYAHITLNCIFNEKNMNNIKRNILINLAKNTKKNIEIMWAFLCFLQH